MIETLQKLVSFRSVAVPEGPDYPYGKETDRAKNYILSLAKEFGMRTVDVPGKYAYIEIGEGETLIGILSHLDVVPEGKGWTHDPFGGEVTEDRIYGRGTTDDKGPTVAVLYAMKDLLEKGNLHKRIRLILGQTEENGEWSDIAAYKEAEEIPSYGFTPDGDFPAIQCELGAMVFDVRMPLAKSGILEANGGTATNMVPSTAKIRTEKAEYNAAGIACHGCAPWLGTNAISKAMHQIATEEGDNVPLAQIYDELIGETIYGEKLGIDCEDESGRLSFNVGQIMMDEESQSVKIMIDVRYPASYQSDGIVKTMVSKFEERGLSCEQIYHVHPLYTPSDSPVLQALVKAYRDVTEDESKPISIGGGTYAKAMPNTVAFGPNYPGHENREHMEDEFILIDDFLKLREIYVEALQNLLEI